MKLLAAILLLTAAAAQEIKPASPQDPIRTDLARESKLLKIWSAPRASGVLITSIGPNSQARGLGLRVGDIILHYDESYGPSLEELAGLVRAVPPTRTVTISWFRNERFYTGRVHGGLIGISGVSVRQGPPNVLPEPSPWEPDFSRLDPGGEMWFCYEYQGEKGWEHDQWRREGDYYVISYETRGSMFNAKCRAKLARVKGLLLTEFAYSEDGVEQCRITRKGDVYTVTGGGKTIKRRYPWGTLPHMVSGWLTDTIPLTPGTVVSSWRMLDATGEVDGRYLIAVKPKETVDLHGTRMEVIPIRQVRFGQTDWTGYHTPDGKLVGGEGMGFKMWSCTEEEAKAFYGG